MYLVFEAESNLITLMEPGRFIAALGIGYSLERAMLEVEKRTRPLVIVLDGPSYMTGGKFVPIVDESTVRMELHRNGRVQFKTENETRRLWITEVQRFSSDEARAVQCAPLSTRELKRG